MEQSRSSSRSGKGAGIGSGSDSGRGRRRLLLERTTEAAVFHFRSFLQFKRQSGIARHGALNLLVLARQGSEPFETGLWGLWLEAWVECRVEVVINYGALNFVLDHQPASISKSLLRERGRVLRMVLSVCCAPVLG